MVELVVRRLSNDVGLPRAAHATDAGLDLQSSIEGILKPGDRMVIPTGIAVAIPVGFAGLVLPRSGLASRHGIGVVNAPGLIDSGYRGEIKVVLINHDLNEAFEIKPRDRIAQLLLVETPAVDVIEKDELPSSDRGTRGFGSSGIR